MLTVINLVNKKLADGLHDDPAYRSLNIVSSSSRIPDTFPTLSVVSLGETTADSDLERIEQASIWSTVQLKAFSEKSLYEASELLNKAGDIMMSAGYQVTMGPEVLSDTKPYCKVLRLRAFVGAGDLAWRF